VERVGEALAGAARSTGGEVRATVTI